jgi:hypothetical protein
MYARHPQANTGLTHLQVCEVLPNARVAAAPKAQVAEGLGLVLLTGRQEARRLIHRRVLEDCRQHVRKVGGSCQDVALQEECGSGSAGELLRQMPLLVQTCAASCDNG